MEDNSNILIIIVPRHPNRSNEVLSIAKMFLEKSYIESSEKFDKNTECLISSSLGEMATYYELSDIVILGGS